jgi:predicted TIM-barrel fold metal-dependent hydrolase
MRNLFRRHPNTKIIWAHTGVGRVVRPIQNHMANIEAILDDPAFSHVYVDISWDEVAKYVVSSPESIRRVADSINRHPDRFLFGTDEVAPSDQAKYTKVYEMYAPLWAALSPQASENVRLRNHERLFDEARRKVRNWETTHLVISDADRQGNPK